LKLDKCVECQDDTPPTPQESDSAPPQESDSVPFRSGQRIRTDGGYESYVDGSRCDDKGFPLPKQTTKPSGAAGSKQVKMCISCTGQGKTSTTCEGIVRSEYCVNCEGEGVVMA